MYMGRFWGSFFHRSDFYLFRVEYQVGAKIQTGQVEACREMVLTASPISFSVLFYQLYISANFRSDFF